MNKLTLNLKHYIFSSRPQLWPNYLVLAGICLKFILVPYIPTALAEQTSGLNYSLLAVEAVQSPSPTQTLSDISENSFILSGGFIQPICSAISSCYFSLTTKPAQKAKKVVSAVQNYNRVIVTAYSSTLDQTDSTPFISANGTYVYDGMIACNFLPFGAKVKFPEIYGDKIFIVEDRMASWNSHKIDIWMPNRQSAIEFGVKKLAYEIVK